MAGILRGRAVQICVERDGSWLVGSGFLITSRLVLTAAHVVRDGTATVFRVDSDLRPSKSSFAARVLLYGHEDLADLALLELEADLPGVEPVRLARVDRTAHARRVPGCWAIGFPQHRAITTDVDGEIRTVYETVQADGEIPLGDLMYSGMLNLHTTKAIPRWLPGTSQWSGMSGAAVFADQRIVGVVTEHHPPAGDTELTITPITFVDRLDGELAQRWWGALGTTRDDLDTVPDAGGHADGFERWAAVREQVKDGHCVAILGPGLTDELLPTRQDMAARLAEASGMSLPFETGKLTDIARVAQWLTVTQDETFPRERYVKEIRSSLGATGTPHGPSSYRELKTLIAAAAAARHAAHHDETHHLLAELPITYYLTTHPLSVMEDALDAVNRTPAVGWCRWNPAATWPGPDEDIFADVPEDRLDRAHPAVFHLFGWAGDPASLVLTEDDYLDYVIRVTADHELVPARIQRMLTESALLLLGFRLEDWDFRGLLRLILSYEGNGRLGRKTHVAVQIDPATSTVNADTAQTYLQAARRYVKEYFRKTSPKLEFDVYWGTAHEFVRELHRQVTR